MLRTISFPGKMLKPEQHVNMKTFLHDFYHVPVPAFIF